MRPLVAFAIAITLLVIGLGAMQLNGAADPPLLVDASKIQAPPARYRNDGTAQVTFAKPELVQELCGQHHVAELIGCASPLPRQMVAPNPCSYSDEVYARIICHEWGHVEGWPADHPKE